MDVSPEAFTTSHKSQQGNFTGPYTLEGILVFLQTEWNKMEFERAQWEVEKAELQARISFLQGEKTGQENLKQDLVRRIKMLEYALQQERARNQHLASRNWQPAFDGVKPPEDRLLEWSPSKDPSEVSSRNPEKGDSQVPKASSKVELQHIRQMLHEVGLSETVAQLRKARVKQLLSVHLNQRSSPSSKTEVSPVQKAKQTFSTSHMAATDPQNDENAAYNDFDFLNSYENPEMGEKAVPSANVPPTVLTEATASAIFDILVAQEDYSTRYSGSPKDASVIPMSQILHESGLLQQHPSQPLANPSTKPQSIATSSNAAASATKDDDWTAVDQQVISRLKEKYRQSRTPKRHASGSSAALSADGSSSDEAFSSSDESSSSSYSQVNNNVSGVEDDEFLFPTSSTNEEETFHNSVPTSANFRSSTVEANNAAASLLSPLAGAATSNRLQQLGDLASLTVANDMEPQGNSKAGKSTDSNMKMDDSLSDSSVSPHHQWTAKYTLRSHFDGVRAVQFHPKEPILITASEDSTLKLWNLQKTVASKKSTNLDVEPVFTFRGHSSAVLACQLHPTRHEELYTAGLDGRVLLWHLPSPLSQQESFDGSAGEDSSLAFSSSSMNKKWGLGQHNNSMLHSDAVWSIALHPSAETLEASNGGYLLSASADSTVHLWQPNDVNHGALRHVFRVTPESTCPTSVSYCQAPSRSHHFLVGSTGGSIHWVDVETGKAVLAVQAVPASLSGSRSGVLCYQVLSHPQHPSLVLSAHMDGAIRFYDADSGKLIQCITAHQDAVTCLSLLNDSVILSGSHDSSIRMWSLHTQTCVQEVTSHRRKYDESIHSVAAHPPGKLIASAGADGLAKVYV